MEPQQALILFDRPQLADCDTRRSSIAAGLSALRWAMKEQDYAGRFDHLLVSHDPTSPAYIREPSNRTVSVILLWNTGKDKGTFYGNRNFAGFSHLVRGVLLLDEYQRREIQARGWSGFHDLVKRLEH
jgi:hypothetical protein